MPKFPFTNYHELNLDWILKKVTALFDASEENAATIRTYNARLTNAEQTATNAETAATAAQQLADDAAENANNALSVAGTADAKADSALTAATSAANAANNALTIAQEARQIAGNAQSAAADAGAVANDASNAAAAAQQTADTNAGNIANLQTDVRELTAVVNNKADVIISNASGTTASFSDGADDMPIKSLVANIEPVQDLHGYDYPWPEGGGKNKLYPPDITWRKWKLDNNSFTTIADSSSLISFTIDGENITITLTTTFGGIGFVVDASPSERVVSATGSIDAVQFWSAYEDGATRISTGTTSCTIPANTSGFIAFRVNSSTTTIKAQLASGSTATSWSPYSNICPISGHTGAVISHSGADMTNPETISFTFPTSAGTVYGGILDILDGSLTVNKKIITYNGTENWRILTGTQQRYYIDKPNDCITSSIRTGYTVSHFGNLWSAGNSGEWGVFVVGGTTFKVLDSGTHFANIAAFKTWLSDQNTNGTPLQVVYPIVTTQTYQLTPEQMNTLLGENNIWSNMGSVDVQYPADTKLYIDGKIAELQALVLEH